MAQERTVVYENNEIHYLLEQKQVKNLNLRVHKDCMVYVSANPDIPAEKVDDFVVSKGAYIRSAQRKFREIAQYASQPKQYVSGETFYLLGSVVLATAVLSFLMQQSQGIEALQMLIGGFVIFMIPQVVGGVVVGRTKDQILSERKDLYIAQ